jgi:ligand-binding sensor domain-containing protein/serine phosphatase RsbU (regulator of sigma subunit)
MKFWSLIFFHFTILLLYGQYSRFHPNFKKFSLKDGLPGQHIKAILQDSLGFLWLGTNAGLVKYDGYEFVLISDTTLQSEFPIFCLAIDKMGKIWMGSRKNGLACYDPVTDKFQYYKHDKSDSTSLLHNDVVSLLVDEKGTLWVGTMLGLSRYDYNSKKFKNYKKNKVYPGTLFHLCLDKDEDAIWCCSLYDGFCAFNRKTENFIRYFFPREWLGNSPFNPFTSCALGKQNIIFVGTRDGLSIFDKKNRSFLKLYQKKENDPCSISGNDLFLSKILIDKSGKVWVGTFHDGLNVLDLNTGCINTYLVKEEDHFSISSNHVSCLFEDRSGIIWIGTNNGLNYYNPMLDYIQVLNKNTDPPLSGNNIKSIYEDGHGRIWIGTSGSGLNMIEKNGNIIHFKNEKNKNNILSNEVSSISSDIHGNIWILTEFGIPKSIYLTNEKKFKNLFNYFKIDERKQNIELNNVVLKDSRGLMWMGGHYAHAFDFKSKKMLSFDENLPDSLRKRIKYIVEIFEDSKHNIWLGSSVTGISKFNPVTNEFEFYSHNENNIHSLSSNSVNDIAEDKLGRIWIATSFGLNCFDPRSKLFYRYFTKNGLPSNNITSLSYDKKQTLWIGTNNGLSRMNLKTGNIINLDVTDGLPSNEITALMMKSDFKTLYVGTTEGLAIINPAKIISNPKVPDIIITNFLVFNKPYKLPKSPAYMKEVVLTYRESVFSVEFSGINFFAPEKNKYAYKLEGFTKSWIDLGNKHSVTFSGLPPGKYKLIVKASNNHNLWSDEKILLNITITPPWWKTNWFYLSFFVLTASSVYTYIRYREKNLRKRKEMLERKIKEATQQIRQEKEKLEEANQIIREQKLLVEEKNKNILDSINYARRIQSAILPSETKWNLLLPESFLIYLPKDIVAGDFYWLEENNHYIYVGIADCTGHGVPGAMVSVICSQALNKSIKEHKAVDTDEILNITRDVVIEQLSKSDNFVRDGMDIGLLRISKINKSEIQFSGANIPLFVKEKNSPDAPSFSELQIIQPDKQPVGKYENAKPFRKYDLHLNNASFLFMFTDGYADQFGGDKGKKLGNKKIREIINNFSQYEIPQQKEMFISFLNSWKIKEEQTDDITFMGLLIQQT